MKALYFMDCYLKEFEATIENVKDEKFIVLNKTAFYPNSGGQPHDTGMLIKDDQDYPVIYAGKFGEDKTRVDFSLNDFDREQITSYEAKVNEIINKKLPVTINIMSKDEAFTIPSVVKLKDAFPPESQEIRVISIPGVDEQACGGTHVANTDEIPNIEIFKAENKGKNNRRIYFRFKPN